MPACDLMWSAACSSNCLGCSTNGAAKCDPTQCDATKVVGYDLATKTCTGMLYSKVLKLRAFEYT